MTFALMKLALPVSPYSLRSFSLQIYLTITSKLHEEKSQLQAQVLNSITIS